MNIDEIKEKVRANAYVYSLHAEVEARSDELTFAEIEEAILAARLLEEYPDTGRGESCLLVGFAKEKPINAVCGWRGDEVVLITVYIPRPPHFSDPWKRGESNDDQEDSV